MVGSTPSGAPTYERGLWLAVIALAALVVALIAGLTVYVAGAPLPVALGDGGMAFVAAVTLGIACWQFLRS